MKILYISSPFFADCDFPLIKKLQNRGYDVTYLILLTPYSLKSTLFSIKNQIKRNEIIPATEYSELKRYEKYMDMCKTFIANRVANRDSSFLSLVMTFKIISFIKKGKFDVIHTDCMFSMWNMVLYWIYGHKMVQTIHDPFPHTGENSLRKKWSYNWSIRLAKKIILLNSKQKDEFCRIYNVDSNRIVLNELGVYDNILSFINPKIREKNCNVLFFGRISPYKGLEYLCEAMMKVKEKIPDVTFTIAGGGKMYFDVKPSEKCNWIEIRNHYIEMEELAEVLQQCSITVCPYIDATQSGVIMTSYALCKPVVATNVGGLCEMIDDDKSGVLIQPKSSTLLADAIIKLLNDSERLKAMQQYIKQTYLDGYKSWDVITERYVSCYKTFS